MSAIFILLTMTFLSLTTLSHADDCDVEGCRCTQMEDTYSLDCYVSALTQADLQMTSAISAKVTSLSLICYPSRRQSSLTSDLFGGFTTLESLSLSQCNISVVTSPLLLTSLRVLTISQCILPTLDPNLLQELTRLENLTIAESGLTRLTRISNLSSLRFLNLSSNFLTTLEPDTPELSGPAHPDTPALSGPAHPDPDTPELSGPAHNDPDTPALSGPAHPNLTFIDLSYNQIKEFPVTLLRSSPQLQQLLLRRTSIKELSVPDDLDLRNLTVLDLSENRLDKVLLSSALM
ncbi:uncharacterized protein LOC131948016 [Physella acuta]|uniref:uncharacterized protein LOC131948016 n=1 Tax=Physella acuta TaxID=109671 RepID=UPI0027DB8D0D|nr:uncharacterized protein LOC131948016 [Physella acuta]